MASPEDARLQTSGFSTKKIYKPQARRCDRQLESCLEKVRALDKQRDGDWRSTRQGQLVSGDEEERMRNWPLIELKHI
jgi:hypothetical protein